jgi:ELWxxDGT repeat protein
VRVKDFPSRIDQLTAVGDALYFSATDAGGGRELWKTDGTAAGTVRVADVWLGPNGSNPSIVMHANGMLYFLAGDPVAGRELWRSDGTAAGTIRVADLTPGPAGTVIYSTAVVDDTLYFSATGLAGDHALWKLDLTPPPPPATVVGRHVFYNNSAFDGRNPAANPADDRAIATDKSALLPGQTPSFVNLTGYTRGLNGVMLDVAGLPPDAVLTAEDFTFRTGRTADPATFAAGPAPLSVTVRRGAGLGGSDRVTLVWSDHHHGRNKRSEASQAVANGWLEVTLKANANTGLAAPDVFYFGNLAGETGDRPQEMAVVTAADVVRTRQNFTRSADVTSPFDHDGDGSVNGADLAAVLADKRPKPAPKPPALKRRK